MIDAQKREHSIPWLKNLKYSVFALGNSSYPQFCEFGKYLDKSLGILGGERLAPVSLGDELGNQEASFRLWIKQVFETPVLKVT